MIGASGVVGVILMAVALLRHPSHPPAGTMADNLSATAAFGVAGSDTPPLQPPESKDAANAKDSAGPKIAPKNPGPQGAATKVPSKGNSNGNGNKGGGKRHIVKHKPPKAKPKPPGKKPIPSSSSVSVVD